MKQLGFIYRVDVVPIGGEPAALPAGVEAASQASERLDGALAGAPRGSRTTAFA